MRVKTVVTPQTPLKTCERCDILFPRKSGTSGTSDRRWREARFCSYDCARKGRQGM